MALRILVTAPSALFLGAVLLVSSAWAEPPEPDSAIPIEEMELLLEPLRKADLEKYAENWVVALKERTTALADKQIELLRASEAQKQALREELARMRRERREFIVRLEAVLQALEEKGGDSAEHRVYVDAVSGLRVVHDAQSFWQFIKAWLTSPEGGVRVGRSLLWFLVIVVAFRLLANVLRGITRRGLRTFGDAPELLQDFLGNSVRNIVFFVGLVVAVSQLGVDIGPLLAAIGGAGFVLAFAMQSTLSNFAAGVMILFYRPYKLGDTVTVAGVHGTVKSMSLVSTTINTPDNQVIVVPNSAIFGGVIVNVTGSGTRRVDMVFSIGYDDDMAKAQKIIEEILTEDDRVLKDPAPAVAVAELADSSVNLAVHPWVRTGDYGAVRGHVTRQVKERFDSAGISIPYPQQEVHVHQVSPA